MRTVVPAHITRIIGKVRARRRLGLRDRLRLRLWQRRQHRRYRAWENKQRLQRIGHGLIWPIRILFALAVVALVLWLGIPIVGLSVALLLAFLMWIVMGAAWL